MRAIQLFILLALLSSCSIEAFNESSATNSKNGKHRIDSNQTFSMKGIDSEIEDPLDHSLFKQTQYPLSLTRRALLRFEAFADRQGRMLTGVEYPITIDVRVSGCGVAAARFVKLCPMSREWTELSSWDYQDTSFGGAGLWSRSGGDFVERECISAEYFSGFNGTRCASNDLLRFYLNNWAAPKLNFNRPPAEMGSFVLTLNQSTSKVYVVGDGGDEEFLKSNQEEPLLSWYE